MTLTRIGSVVSGSPVPAVDRAEDGHGVDETASGAAVFADPQSRSLESLLDRIAPTDVPVMIIGETGTGKERLARYIHERSGRAGEFAVVHCSLLCDLNIGEPGSGEARIRAALGSSQAGASSRGTLFFADVGDLSSTLQCELLRLLRANNTVTSDVGRARIITSSSTDLGEALLEGRFRRDLFYRLNGAPIRLLPLRQRPGDIVPLANHFLRLYARSSVLPLYKLGRDALSALQQHPWPGNVRELENVIRFCVLTTPRPELTREDLRLESARTVDYEPMGESFNEKLAGFLTLLFQNPGPHLYDDVERLLVTRAFQATGGNQVHTATLLGVSRNVVRTLLKKHGLLKAVGKPED